MNSRQIHALRVDLLAARYSVDEVQALLGLEADAARNRGAFAAAQQALRLHGDTPLSILIRIFLLGEATSERFVTEALPTLGAVGAIELGLLEEIDSGKLRAILSLNPVSLEDSHVEGVREWFVISDLDDHLRRGSARTDHVMGVGGATKSLIAQLPPGTVSSSLDLGTGCGIVALHLALRGPVVATDISERALIFARANARLNDLHEVIEFRQGDLFEPVHTDSFELIASNPPFVITPRQSTSVSQYDYRDAGLVGDELVKRVVTGALQHLSEDGMLLALANWESPWGMNGLTRVEAWVREAAGASTSVAAWVIERDSLSPAQYAETWIRDGGIRPGDSQFESLLSAWLEDFAARQITAIGLGIVRIKRLPATLPSEPIFYLEQAAGSFDSENLGVRMHATFAHGIDASLLQDNEILAKHWLLDKNVVEVREHRPGEESPRAIMLRTTRPIERSVAADSLLAAAVGACDGELTLKQICEALTTLLEVDYDACCAALVTSVRELSWLGMISPADD